MTAQQLLALIVGIITLATAAVGAYQGHGNKAKIAEVHVLVNGQMSDMVTRVRQLVTALETAGVAVPPPPPPSPPEVPPAPPAAAAG